MIDFPATSDPIPVEFVPVDSGGEPVRTLRRRRARRRAVWAIVGSTLLHVGGVAIVVGLVLWATFSDADEAIARADGLNSELVEREAAIDPTDHPRLVSDESLVLRPLEEVDSREFAFPEGPEVALPTLPEPDESFDWEAFAASRFLSDVDRAANETDEERYARLNRLEWMLGRVSNEERVGEMTNSLSKWLGASERKAVATNASEPFEDDPSFDFDTAQIHDVVVEQDETGGDLYLLILADAEGRLHRAETDAATGKRLKSILDRVKANPLLEQLYRGVVMGILDGLAKE